MITLRDFVAANFSTTCEKSNDRSKSLSMLSSARPDSRLCVIEVRSRFFINFVLENYRSPLQLDTIKTKYIRNTTSTLGNLHCKLYIHSFPLTHYSNHYNL